MQHLVYAIALPPPLAKILTIGGGRSIFIFTNAEAAIIILNVASVTISEREERPCDTGTGV
jgi:hypothetical protein